MSQPLPPREFDELRRLIQSLHDETISSDEQARLEQWLLRDEAAREVYVQYMYLYARLRWDCRRGPEPETSRSNGQSPPTPTPIMGYLGDAFWAGADFLSRPFVLTLALAVGLPGLILLILFVNLSHRPVDNRPEFAGKHEARVVARVTRTHRCVWSGEDPAIVVGAKLTPGAPVELREGLSEIEFTNGTRVVLQGPAVFEPRGLNAAFLREGSLVADVSRGAKGFSIQTPLATVVDLGTEFGVSVAPDGKEEAHVFKGEVEIETGRAGTPKARPPRRIHAGEAAQIRLAKDGKTVRTKEIVSEPDRFVRRVPPDTNVGLPEPRIVFSHQGDRDPTTEGWILQQEPRNAALSDQAKTKPVRKDGQAAWSIDNRSGKTGARYRILDAQGLNRQMVAKAKTQGWVLRACIKVVGNQQPGKGLCVFSYWDGHRGWRLRPTVDQQGDQALLVFSESSLGKDVTIKIPNSRDRYVDYEVRYHPETNDADVYINGKLAVTKVFASQRSAYSLHFGTINGATVDGRFARVEWGILDNAAEPNNGSEKKGAERTP
jgi:hypothetical protein